ncbi:protein-lysine N-methyltransferase [Sporobolomyces koalae]|uniref:protein-lysine N-methyltransferase n=1 Tax=Sporobolomyces koalae TaxID=500713 RepID=UPI0031723C08
MLSLADWLTAHSVYLDRRIELVQGPAGLHVVALAEIAPFETIGTIPKSLVLSHRTSSLAREQVSLELLDTHSPALRLAVHVLYELCQRAESRWYGYLDHSPQETVSIALLWRETAPAREWIRGTDLERQLERTAISVVRKLFCSGPAPISDKTYEIGRRQESLARIFETTVRPLFAAIPSGFAPTLDQFFHAYSLVSTRAFQVDAYHWLALVPLADAFNHLSPGENHVQFASDTWVCPECGALDECLHDVGRSEEPSAIEIERSSRAEETCDMVTTGEPISPGQELFNSYGPLSNARLIAEYGFALEANEWDQISFDRDQVARVLRQYLDTLIPAPVDRSSATGIEEMVQQDEEEHPLIAMPTTSREEGLYFDADAKLSRALWLSIALQSIDAYYSSNIQIERLESASKTAQKVARELLRIAIAVEDGDDATETGECTILIEHVYSSVIEVIARTVLDLCQARIDEQCRPELSGSDLLDLADIEHDDKMKLAIGYLASERLLIERVVEKWEAVIAFLS